MIDWIWEFVCVCVCLGIGEMGMGLGPEPLNVGNWSIGDSKSGNNKKKKSKEGKEVDSGCWIKFRFIRSCISSHTQVDNPVSSSSSIYGTLRILSSQIFTFVKCFLYI